jgi:hypothetical protein
MAQAPPVQDFFLTLGTPDEERLALALQQQQELEALVARGEPPTSKSLMHLGEDLCRLAFPSDAALGDFIVTLASAVKAEATLRLWIQADELSLALLPWEYLCLTETAVDWCREQGIALAKYQPHTTLPEPSTFLALHPHVSLVRQARPEPPAARLERLGRLRVLVAWANPANEYWRDIIGLEMEIASIRSALDRLPSTHAEVRMLAHATPAELRHVLEEWQPHVLHYAGHGAFPDLEDPAGDLSAPSLVLEGKHAPGQRRHAYLTDAELRSLCARHGVQVVVLNSCWGARGSHTFTGLARALSGPGEGNPVPVVVAHQMPIAQSAAAGFSGPFYQNLAVACPVEQCVRTFRQDAAIGPHGCGAADWGIPVVFLGVRDSALFRSDRADAHSISFGELISQHVPIVGRQFLRDEFSRFQKARPGGIFLLTAAPGTGKTAFLAQCCESGTEGDPGSATAETAVAHTRGPCATAVLAVASPEPVHFFYRATAGTTDPDECIKVLHQGLLGRHGILDETPTNDRVELRRRLTTLLKEVSARCARNGWKELLLIDALDEADKTAADGKNAVEVLPELLPPYVYLLVTSRPVPLAEALARRSDVFRFHLDPASEANRRDAAEFCVRELRGRVQGGDAASVQRLADRLAEQAGGNFLVLKLFLSPQLLGQQVTVADLERAGEDLTPSVAKQYETFFERATRSIADDPDKLDLFYRVLGAFGTARAPVTAEQVCATFGLKRAHWDWAFGRISQFLERGGLRQEERGALTYRLYHETFREFLADRLASDLRDCHRRWAERGLKWRELRGYEQLYALRHLPAHLIAASREPTRGASL